MRLFAYITAAIALLALVVSTTPEEASAKNDRRIVAYEFPTPIKGFDLGEKALRAHILSSKATAEFVFEKTFDNMPHVFLMDALKRFKANASEFSALNSELEDANLNSYLSGHPYTEGVRLDKAGISERKLVRAFGKTVKDFEPEEAAALLVQMGYNERWLLARIKGTDLSHTAFDEIEKHFKDEDDVDDVWADLTRGKSYAQVMERWVHSGYPQIVKPIAKILDDKDKKLPASFGRVLQSGDGVLISKAMTKLGIKQAIFTLEAEDQLKDLRKSSAATAKSVAQSLIQYQLRAEMQKVNWLDITKAKHVLRVSRLRGTLPSLKNFEDKTWESLADFGLTDEILTLAGGSDLIAIFEGGKVRAHFGSRKQGIMSKGSLTLTGLYGARSEELAEVKILADGLIGSASKKLNENRKQSNLLLRAPMVP